MYVNKLQLPVNSIRLQAGSQYEMLFGDVKYSKGEFEGARMVRVDSRGRASESAATSTLTFKLWMVDCLLRS